jgi:hypothetical protein
MSVGTCSLRSAGSERVPLVAHMLLAALNELALVLALADDSGTTQHDAEGAIDVLLGGLLAGG